MGDFKSENGLRRAQKVFDDFQKKEGFLSTGKNALKFYKETVIFKNNFLKWNIKFLFCSY